MPVIKMFGWFRFLALGGAVVIAFVFFVLK